MEEKKPGKGDFFSFKMATEGDGNDTFMSL